MANDNDIPLPLITERDTCLYECVCPQTYWHKCTISVLCSVAQCLFLIKKRPAVWKGQVCFYFLHQLFLFCLLAVLRTDDNSAPLGFLWASSIIKYLPYIEWGLKPLVKMFRFWILLFYNTLSFYGNSYYEYNHLCIFCLNGNKNIWPSVQKSSHDRCHEVIYLISEVEMLLNLRYLSMFYNFILYYSFQNPKIINKNNLYKNIKKLCMWSVYERTLLLTKATKIQ